MARRERIRTLTIRLDGREVAAPRLRLPEPGPMSLAAWAGLEDRLSARAMRVPAVRRKLERDGVAGTVFRTEGVYEIWSTEHAGRLALPAGKRPAQRSRRTGLKAVPKGFRRLPSVRRP